MSNPDVTNAWAVISRWLASTGLDATVTGGQIGELANTIGAIVRSTRIDAYNRSVTIASEADSKKIAWAIASERDYRNDY